jgi:hypothetical protein
MIAETCGIVRSRAGQNTVALSGGVFQNMLLLDRTVRTLNERDFRVLIITMSRPTTAGLVSARPRSQSREIASPKTVVLDAYRSRPNR